jgi:predicted regulator of Ras-like GTPase activity (Roadblock/LC7/MglB family)
VCYNPCRGADRGAQGAEETSVSDGSFLTPGAMLRIEDELRGFRQLAKARVAFLIDRNGQLLGQAGDSSGVDTTALAALTASNIAASKAIAELMGEQEFAGILHEGENDHLHISLVCQEAILLVLFDAQTSIGLVRLRVRKTARRLAQVFSENALEAAEEIEGGSPFAEITEEDIDQLFR